MAGFLKLSREDRIRTCDPLVPNQVRYRPALLPDSLTETFVKVRPSEINQNWECKYKGFECYNYLFFSPKIQMSATGFTSNC